jgi:hypothetical protein
MHGVPHSEVEIMAAGPLRARVTGAADVRIGWGEPDWLGPGVLRTPDGISGSIFAIAHEPVLVLRLEAGSAPPACGNGDFATPAVGWHFDPSARLDGGAPDDLRAFGHQYTEFALPVFSDAAMERWRLLPIRPSVVMPLGVVAPDGRTILLAPLRGFHEQVIAVPDREHPESGLRAGWHGDVDEVPAGFATELAVIAGKGARECFAIWARLLRAQSGVTAPARDSDALGTRVSYWTDNGSAYWYRTEPGHDPASTVVAAVEDLEARGLPIGAVQLDSWWYPHEVLRPFDSDEWEVPPTGMIRWEPRPDVLPDGIAPLRERLGRRPLVAHCRHLSSQSPYADEFPMWVDKDRAHPQGGELYERLLDQAVTWGVEVFEHDWLIECFLGVRGLRAPGRAAAWQEGIDDALGARNLHAQWCMASPADFAQASRLRNLTSIRTSGDHGYLVGPELLWAWFLHTNVMARALGLWPYKDVFHSTRASATREVEALLSALSAGPVGIGDRIGEADVELIRRTCRADGVLVRPDVPIAAIDRACFEAPVWSEALLVGSAHTEHTAGRWAYVLTCNVAADHQPHDGRVNLTELGEDRPTTAEVAVFDWRTRRVEVVSGESAYDVALDSAGWDFRVVAPVLGDIAVIGDPALYACAGDARISDVAVEDGGIVVTVLGAAEQVRLVGWSRAPIRARAWSPASGAVEVVVEYEARAHLWTAAVDVGDAGWANLHLQTGRP